MKILEKDISQLIDLMRKGQVTSEELTGEYLKNIDEKTLDKKVYKSLDREEALSQARSLDEKRRQGESLGKLAGILIAITEDISKKGLPTEAGSRILKGYVPPFDASIIERLEEEDAIILGNIKIKEFGLEDSDLGAEVLKEGGALAVLGSSSGGRGLVKFKPSYGLVSRYGVIAATSSLSPLNIMARTTKDLGLVLEAIAGYDDKDSTSIRMEDIPKEPKRNLKEDLKIKFPKELMEEVQSNGFKAILEDLGFKLEGARLENQDYIFPAYQVLASAEFSSLAGRYDGVGFGFRAENYETREDLYKNTRSQGFEKEAKKTIIFGNHVINSDNYNKYYKQGQKVRRLIKEEVDGILQDGSLFLLGLSEDLDLDRRKAYEELASMTGYPMLTLGYKDEDGQYMDLNFLAPAFHEERLLELGSILEKELKIRVGGRQ